MQMAEPTVVVGPVATGDSVVAGQEAVAKAAARAVETEVVVAAAMAAVETMVVAATEAVVRR